MGTDGNGRGCAESRVPVEKAVDDFQGPLPARRLGRGSVEIFCGLDDQSMEGCSTWNIGRCPRGYSGQMFHVEQSDWRRREVS